MYEVPVVQKVFFNLNWDQRYLVDYAIVIALLFLSLLGFHASFRYLVKAVFQFTGRFEAWAAIGAVACLPLMFKYYNYIYDFPVLFLFTLALGLMARKKWDIFLAVYVFSCFNKETTILLTVIFVIHYFDRAKLDRRQFWKLTIIQLSLFGLIKILLYFIFLSNAGDFVEFHLVDYNLVLLRKIKLVPFIFLWGPIIFLTFYKWREKPKFIKDSIWILLPLIFLTLFLGFLDELRDYYEVYSIVFLLISFSINSFIGADYLKKLGKKSQVIS